ncbi:HAD family phosphatase [Bacillus sp. BRMEA1]|uniref:Cof-type HAD-IIB family hydrolase n=1 Tax=Neobacillus endophyticus TaxID=2738405 RepID=UPI001565D3C7|nr:Cof-type HAD-IIB family hydrolase [Neobacillus endophyticus]NRD77245.1 HAD family phosphatase [Neobacillus endophyticus]
MIKCIATDMDGTLLNTMQEITEENRKAIMAAQEKGIEVVVATGRSYQQATHALADAGLTCPVICVNGAEIRTREGEVVDAFPIDKNLARGAASKLAKTGVYFEVYTNQGAYTVDVDQAVTILADIVLSTNPQVDPDEVRAAVQARLSDGLVHKIEDYELLFADEDQKIYKLLAFSLDADKLKEAEEALSSLEDLTVTSSGHDNIEITHRDAQKGIALESFVKAKGISLAETMAIGDNYNDVTMFERVGKAVAMGNANFEIKALCDEVTDTNEESGVAKAILSVL